MKKIIISSIFLVIAIMFASCEQDFDIENPDVNDVDQYVSLLKKGEYSSLYLPNFSPEAIPELLKHASDFSKIEQFPSNTKSAYAAKNVRLGECLLWTVETIRVKYPEESNILRYASSVPKLIHTQYVIDLKDKQGVAPDDYFLTDTQLTYVLELYEEWWNENQNRDIEMLRKNNPLVESNIQWF